VLLGRGLSVTGRRRDESESRLQDSVVVTDRKVGVAAGPTLADTYISYVTPSLRYETVYLDKPASSAGISD
jgi:3'-phosphoadenosine 5'-phosphosulfate sulfotransferase (PAPS reductase)/FAD synthetase